MRKNRIIWTVVLLVSIILLIGYSIWGWNYIRYNSYIRHSYYGRGMMDDRFYNNIGPSNNGEKLSIDRIKANVNDYIQDYNNKLTISDIFVYKDTDYYISIEEKDTGRGAMELLVNPYNGQIYPEYGPNMMWNEKYGMHGSYGMMGGTRFYNDNNDDSKAYSEQISKDEAEKIADKYVKDNLDKRFSVPGEGHKFYGYYTFHINENNKTVGMLSVNYYTKAVWYHNWHGELEQVISEDKD